MHKKAKYTLQLGKCVVKDVNLHVNNCSYGYKTLYQRIKLIQQRQGKTLQLAICLNTDANF